MDPIQTSVPLVQILHRLFFWDSVSISAQITSSSGEETVLLAIQPVKHVHQMGLGVPPAGKGDYSTRVSVLPDVL